MRILRNIFLILAVVMRIDLSGQSKEEIEVVREGRKLYNSEMASWYGTDIFLERFNDKRQNSGGYFSYTENNRSICVFFSRDSIPKALASFSFDSTYNVETAIVDDQERALSKLEGDLLVIRQQAMLELKRDTIFKFFKDMNPNLIPLNDEDGKRVYILTGPKNHGVVVFGNDYLLTFSKENKLKQKRRLHRNIISIEYGKNDGKIVLSTMHTHRPETGDLISATDIATLMLYEKFAGWKQHYVISQENVSIWNCEKNELLVMTRKAWDRIGKDQKK